MSHIFIIDSDDEIRDTVAGYLKLWEFEVSEFKELAGVKDALKSKKPDLIIVETTFEEGDGFTFIKEIRQKSNIPIFIISKRNTESDRITGFEVGADDYLVKPFSTKELALRVTAILRRISNS